MRAAEQQTAWVYITSGGVVRHAVYDEPPGYGYTRASCGARVHRAIKQEVARTWPRCSRCWWPKEEPSA